MQHGKSRNTPTVLQEVMLENFLKRVLIHFMSTKPLIIASFNTNNFTQITNYCTKPSYEIVDQLSISISLQKEFERRQQQFEHCLVSNAIASMPDRLHFSQNLIYHIKPNSQSRTNVFDSCVFYCCCCCCGCSVHHNAHGWWMNYTSLK